MLLVLACEKSNFEYQLLGRDQMMIAASIHMCINRYNFL